MGYYINVTPTGQALGTQKANVLIKEGAEELRTPPNFSDIPSGKALLCAVNNGIFEAVGHCYSESELEAFKYNDGRPRRWLLMDEDVVLKIRG